MFVFLTVTIYHNVCHLDILLLSTLFSFIRLEMFFVFFINLKHIPYLEKLLNTPVFYTGGRIQTTLSRTCITFRKAKHFLMDVEIIFLH